MACRSTTASWAVRRCRLGSGRARRARIAAAAMPERAAEAVRERPAGARPKARTGRTTGSAAAGSPPDRPPGSAMAQPPATVGGRAAEDQSTRRATPAHRAGVARRAHPAVSMPAHPGQEACQAPSRDRPAQATPIRSAARAARRSIGLPPGAACSRHHRSPRGRAVRAPTPRPRCRYRRNVRGSPRGNPESGRP